MAVRPAFSGRLSVFEGLGLLCLSFVLAAMVVTGRYGAFIIPPLAPFIGVSAAVFFVWGLTDIVRARSLYRRIYTPVAGVFVIALLFAFPAFFGIVPKAPAIAAASDTDATGEERPFGIDFENREGDGINTKEKRIILNTKNWYRTIFEITKHNKDYEGYDIYLEGFVSYHDDELTGNDFTPSRYLMICCVNDMSPFGIGCNVQGARHYPEYTWVAVKGKIKSSTYHGMNRPLIDVEEVRPAGKIEGYVYPYK